MHGQAIDEHDLVAWPEVQHRDHSFGDDGEHADQQPHSSAADLRTQQERGGAEDPGEQSQWWEEIAGAAYGEELHRQVQRLGRVAEDVRVDHEGLQHDRTEKNHRSEEHTSELQSRGHLVCRLLLEKKKKEYKILK